MADKKTFHQNFLRITALIVALVGAAGSLYFMFNAGRKQPSVILLGLFTGWVLSPFIGLAILNKIINRRKAVGRGAFYWMMIILTICSLIVYSGALNTPETKNAFVFLVFPIISWFIIVIFFLITRKISHRNLIS